VLGPDGWYEHVRLRFVRLGAADVAALSAAAAVLGEPVRFEEVRRRCGWTSPTAPSTRRPSDPVIGLVSLVAGLLDLAWTADAELPQARLQPATGDVVLTGTEGAAYQRTVTRLNGM